MIEMEHAQANESRILARTQNQVDYLQHRIMHMTRMLKLEQQILTECAQRMQEYQEKLQAAQIESAALLNEHF